MKQTAADRRQKWRDVLRFVLGMLQMFGAVVSLVLLAQTGISTATLTSVILTGVTTTISVLLFGGKRGNPR